MKQRFTVFDAYMFYKSDTYVCLKKDNSIVCLQNETTINGIFLSELLFTLLFTL